MSLVRRGVRTCLACILAAVCWAPVVAQVPDKSDTSAVVAKQGSVEVTLADIDAFASRVPDSDRPVFFNNPERLQAVIVNLLLQKQLAAQAREAGLDNDPTVKAQIVLAIDDVLGKARIEQFKASLKDPDLEQLAKEEYLAHKETYRIPARVDVKHVLISTETRTADEARALAETVEKEARVDPDQFDALVEKYSDDPSKATNHGLMPDAGSGRYVPAFAKASTDLGKVGAISPVVQTKYGFHVLKLVKLNPAKQREFSEVKPEIVMTLRKNYVDKAVKDHTDTIRNLPLDANPDAVASLRSRYGVVPVAADVEAKAKAR
jgi:peptidyl-prolyl cis-trans isomerase C